MSAQIYYYFVCFVDNRLNLIIWQKNITSVRLALWSGHVSLNVGTRNSVYQNVLMAHARAYSNSLDASVLYSLLWRKSRGGQGKHVPPKCRMGGEDVNASCPPNMAGISLQKRQRIRLYLLNYVIVLFWSNISCLQLYQMFIVDNFVNRTLKFWTTSSVVPPPQISHQIYATVIIINLFAIFSYQFANIYHAMAGHQKNTVQLAGGLYM